MRLLVKALALTALAAAPVLAQGNPQVRQGFTISFGLGAGSAGFTCQDCPSDRTWAPSGYIRLGGALRPNFILAGEVNAWTKTESEDNVDYTLTTSTATLLGQWYPDAAGGFFVSGGVGVGSVSSEAKAGGISITSSTTAFGYQAGAGYDIRLGKNFSLTPFATYFGTAKGKVEDTDEKIDSNVFHFGLGVTWH